MRFSNTALLFALSAGALCALTPERSAAQADSSEAVTPPRLLDAHNPEPPPDETFSQPVAVELELTIDEHGDVVDATVSRSAGEAFDTRALTAARSLKFDPAQRGARPIRAKIRYLSVFSPPAPAAAPAPPAAAPEAEPAPAPIPAAPTPRAAALPAPPSAPALPASEDDTFEATAEVQAPPREPTRRSIGGEELTTIPGTRGDALRAIEVMPGVARTGLNDGTPVLRGSSGYESQVFLDGIPVLLLYHFGGLTSFFNSQLLERVDLYPGNFSSRFGRASGGIVDIRARDPKRDRFHGSLDLSLIDSSVVAETPLGKSTSVALAGRRSNIDLVYSKVVPKDSFSVVAAPVYYDYQAIVSSELGAHHHLRVLGYGARDSLELVFAHPNETDPTLSGAINAAIGFHRLQVELRSEFSPAVTQELTLAAGRLDVTQEFGELRQDYSGYELYGRGEWSAELAPWLRATAGGDFFGWFFNGTLRGPAPGQIEGNPHQQDPNAALSLVDLKATANAVQPAAYAELSVHPTSSLLLVPSVRADYASNFQSWSVDPRLGARLSLSEHTTLKAGLGRYSQTAQFWQAIPGIGNPQLKPYDTLQASAGFEQSFGKPLKLGVEGFYKYLEHNVVGTPNGARPRFENDGTGRIYGAELSLEARPDADTFGYLAYTLSRSERSDHGAPYRVFDHDQTHILSVAANRKLGRGWQVGARFRYVTGDPLTPIVGSTFDARSGVYAPSYGAVNSARNQAFQQLDARVEKRWTFQAFSLTAYLDLQNAYNAKNAQGYSYSYDYRQRQAVTGLPIFPNLGLRGEL